MQKKEEKEKILPFLNGLEIVGASDLSSESSPRWHVISLRTVECLFLLLARLSLRPSRNLKINNK